MCPCRSAEYECSTEALTVAAMLSVQNVFLPESLSNEKSARRHYAVKEGDHLTLLNVHAAFENSKRSGQWSQARMVNHRSLKRACETRQQLAAYLAKLEIPMVSCGREHNKLRRCIVSFRSRTWSVPEHVWTAR